jgi:hypothetical protein
LEQIMVVRLAKRTAAAGKAKQANGDEGRDNLRARKSAATQAAPSKKNGRFAAPAVRLGMTPAEVRGCAGQPECILFGPEDHVEWQFGRKGVDVTNAPCLYVTTLTFASGRVIRVTEKMAELTH